MMNAGDYSKKTCHAYARDMFNSKKMAASYLDMYEKIMNGEKLNTTKPAMTEAHDTKILPWKD